MDDILHHGSHDVIWCYIYERMVSIYDNIKNNHKDYEISFVNYHRRLLFTWVFSHLQVDKDFLMPPQRVFVKLHHSLIGPKGYIVDKEGCLECPIWHTCGLLKVSSIEKGKELWTLSTNINLDFPCLRVIQKKGIIIGGKKICCRDTTSEEK